MNSESSATSYNKQPYPTFANRDSHPEKLATLARLVGISATLPEQSSVLEIGCGTGGNLIPMAERYPAAKFVGIDISSRHIEACQAMCRELNLKNVDFRCVDVMDLDCEGESVDYLICHGVYTWVAEEVQHAIMRVLGRVLKPEGIAYVSYNTLPGWHQRGILRDVMAFGSGGANPQDPMNQLTAGISFMHLLAQNRQQEGDLYGAYLREGVRRLSQSEPSYVYHEYLEPCNKPLLFSEFAMQAQQHGLFYLAEAKQAMHSYEDLTEDAKKFLAGFGGNLIAREQALDFFRNRMFRESLLCKSGAELNRDLKGSVFRELSFSTEWRVVDEEASSSPDSSGETLFREIINGREMRLPSGGFSDLLGIVGGLGVAGGGFDEISAETTLRNPAEHDEQVVMRALGMLWQGGFVDATCSPAPVETSHAAVARITAYARRQALDNVAVTSLRHQSYILSPVEQQLLVAATGERRIEELVAAVWSQQESGGVSRGEIENALARLINLGFFRKG